MTPCRWSPVAVRTPFMPSDRRHLRHALQFARSCASSCKRTASALDCSNCPHVAQYHA